MTTRIRYERNQVNPELLVSTSSFLLPGGELVNVWLNTQLNSYQLVDTNTGKLVGSETSNSLVNLKKLVRSTLLQLGVPLQVEVRNFNREEAA